MDASSLTNTNTQKANTFRRGQGRPDPKMRKCFSWLHFRIQALLSDVGCRKLLHRAISGAEVSSQRERYCGAPRKTAVLEVSEMEVARLAQQNKALSSSARLLRQAPQHIGSTRMFRKSQSDYSSISRSFPFFAFAILF